MRDTAEDMMDDTTENACAEIDMASPATKGLMRWYQDFFAERIKDFAAFPTYSVADHSLYLSAAPVPAEFAVHHDAIERLHRREYDRIMTRQHARQIVTHEAAWIKALYGEPAKPIIMDFESVPLDFEVRSVMGLQPRYVFSDEGYLPASQTHDHDAWTKLYQCRPAPRPPEIKVPDDFKPAKPYENRAARRARRRFH